MQAAPTGVCARNDDKQTANVQCTGIQFLPHSSREDPIQHGSLKHTFIAFSIKRKKKSGGGCGREGSCRGGSVKEEVTFITGPFLQADAAVFPQQRTLACPLEWKGNVNIQESIFGRMWGVSLEVVGEGGRGAAMTSQRQNVGGV